MTTAALVGVITDGDLAAQSSIGLFDLSARDVMTHDPMWVSPGCVGRRCR
jgi:CBS domain-containing protein